jgi:hypothetical protein
MGRRSIAFFVCALLVAGCGPTPTPFPVQPIVTTEAPEPTQAVAAETSEPVRLRYGILPNAADYAPLNSLQTDSVDVSIVSAGESQANYDALMGYGMYEDWQVVDDGKPPVSLLLDVTRPPLNNPAIREALESAIRVPDVVASLAIPGIEVLQEPPTDTTSARTALANAGFPSGITLYGWTVDAPGVEMMLDQLEAANIRLTPLAPGTDNAHLIIGQVTPSDGQEAIPLYTLPLSYTVGDNVSTAITDDGWLIVAPR